MKRIPGGIAGNGMGHKGILNKSKKMIDKVLIIRYYNQADCETEMFQNKK